MAKAGGKGTTSRPCLWLSLCAALLASFISDAESLAMPKSRKKKHYAVVNGRRNGIFDTWDECKAQVTGFSGAKYKSFPTRTEAEAYIAQHGAAASNIFGGGGQAVAASSSSSAGGPGRIRTDRGASAARGAAVPVSTARPSCRLASSGAGPSFGSAAQKEHRVERRTDARPNEGGAAEVDVQIPPSNELRVTVHFDGGARGNPGVAGAGAVVVAANGDDGSVSTKSVRRFCGTMETNNVAEYTGMLEGLRAARETTMAFVADRRRQWRDNCGEAATAAGERWKVDVSVRGDSNLIIKQMNGEYAVKSPNLKSYFEGCRGIASELMVMGASAPNGEVNVSFSHVYREDNKLADALANQAMDQKRSWTTVELIKLARGGQPSSGSAAIENI